MPRLNFMIMKKNWICFHKKIWLTEEQKKHAAESLMAYASVCRKHKTFKEVNTIEDPLLTALKDYLNPQPTGLKLLYQKMQYKMAALIRKITNPMASEFKFDDEIYHAYKKLIADEFNSLKHAVVIKERLEKECHLIALKEIASRVAGRSSLIKNHTIH